jgi:hypothetical protein
LIYAVVRRRDDRATDDACAYRNLDYVGGNARAVICDLKVRHSAKNQEFRLALSPNGEMLAFLDGGSLKVYHLPLVAELHHP